MVIQKVRSYTLQEAVYNELLSAIVSGLILPGETITLEDLAKKFGVSIMPVREAIRKLEADNLIHIGVNRRIVIKELSLESLKEVLQLRLILEGLAVRTASKIRSEASLKKLEKLYYEISHADDGETHLRINRDFHRTIYEQANLPILLEIIDMLWERVSPYLHILFRQEKFVNVKKFVVLKSHKGMLQGMQKQNPEEVYKWLEKDLVYAAEIISNMFEKKIKEPIV
jgi:DNA-binding GntR family transcriptional regulator